MSIRCLVVTPERTEVDREATFVTLPMFDGELGVGIGRAAMIGRLGYGVLKLQSNGETQRMFVDGGFAQVENNVVSVLTGRVIPLNKLSVTEAESALAKALDMPANNKELAQLRETALLRARGQLRAAKSAD